MGELFEARSGICLSDFMVDCGGRSLPFSDETVQGVKINRDESLKKISTKFLSDLPNNAEWIENFQSERLRIIFHLYQRPEN